VYCGTQAVSNIALSGARSIFCVHVRCLFASWDRIREIVNPAMGTYLSIMPITKTNAGADAVRGKADAHAAMVVPIIAAIRGEGITSLTSIARELTRRLSIDHVDDRRRDLQQRFGTDSSP
jgi:hypothetical protein